MVYYNTTLPFESVSHEWDKLQFRVQTTKACEGFEAQYLQFRPQQITIREKINIVKVQCEKNEHFCKQNIDDDIFPSHQR